MRKTGTSDWASTDNNLDQKQEDKGIQHQSGLHSETLSQVTKQTHRYVKLKAATLSKWKSEHREEKNKVKFE